MVEKQIEEILKEIISSIRENNKESRWRKASFDDLCIIIYKKVNDGSMTRDVLMAKIREITANRLNELYNEGYNIKAIRTMRKTICIKNK